MYVHRAAVRPGTWYRTDTASGSNTPTTVYATDSTANPIPTEFGASGSTVRTSDRVTPVVTFYSSLATVYLKSLTYGGGPDGLVVTSTGTNTAGVSSSGSSGSDLAAVIAGLPGTYASYKNLARNPDEIITGAITRDANGAATSATVTWPDATTGTYTATTVSTAFPGAVDAYTITYGSPVTRTYTQPAVTRDAATGAVTNVPAIVVS